MLIFQILTEGSLALADVTMVISLQSFYRGLVAFTEKMRILELGFTFSRQSPFYLIRYSTALS